GLLASVEPWHRLAAPGTIVRHIQKAARGNQLFSVPDLFHEPPVITFNAESDHVAVFDTLVLNDSRELKVLRPGFDRRFDDAELEPMRRTVHRVVLAAPVVERAIDGVLIVR